MQDIASQTRYVCRAERSAGVPEMIDRMAVQKGRTAKMRLNPKLPMTAEEFLYAYEGVEGRWELVDGAPIMMTGG